MGSFRKVGLTGQHTRIGLLCCCVRPSRSGHGEPRPSLDGETHWLLAHCSVLKVRAPTRRKGLQRWGRATSYCRHTALRRQPSLDPGRRRHGSEPSPNARRARIRNGRGLAGASAAGIGSRQQEGRTRTTCDRPELGPVHRHPSAVCEGAPGGMRFAADPLRRPRSPGRNRRHLGRRDARPARGPHHRT